MRVTLLRHGRTVANAGGLLQGRVDNPLDVTGEAQAVAAAQILAPADRVVSSPLRRARETAAAFGLPVEIDERWIELDYGEWDERPIADIPAAVWSQWRGDLNLRPPNGETLRERFAVRHALSDLAQQSMDAEPDRGQHIVIVSHVSPIKAAVAWALGVGDEVGWRTRLTTGSYTQIDISRGHGTLVGFNIVPQADPG